MSDSEGGSLGYFVYRSGIKNWRLVEGSGQTRRAVPKEAYRILGFNIDMTIDDARTRAKQLNLQKSLENRTKIGAAKRIAHLKLVDSAYLPSLWTSRFEEHLKEITYGKEDRIKTVFQHWVTVQKIIVALEIDPKHFFDNRNKIYNVFIKRKFSSDYAGRLIRMFNLWGLFFSRQTNSYFQPIPQAKPIERQRLVEAREGKTGIRREANPLTVETLMFHKNNFMNLELMPLWNWLFIAVWFGLRPSEVDSLKNQKCWRIEKDEKNKIDVLMVYQSKLSSVPKDKRWKPIPILFKEQFAALAIVQSGAFRRPLAKTLKKYIGENIDNYSPRKGFVDLMLSKGFSIEDVSIFMGHRTIETTWRHYKDKFTFKMPKVG